MSIEIDDLDDDLFLEDINLSFLNDSNWAIRGEIKEWISRACYTNKNVRRIFKDFVESNSIYNKTGWFLNELQNVVDNNSNLQVHIFGKTGSGKSLVAQKIAFAIQDIENKSGKKSNIWVEFTLKQCTDKLKQMTPGDILIRDEQSNESGEMANIRDDAADNLKKAVRAKNLHFIDCQPDAVVSSTLNFLIQVLGYNKKTKVSLALIYVVTQDVTKIDRIITDLKGYLLISKHHKEDFLKAYEKRKMAYIDSLLETGGLEGATTSGAEIKDQAEALIKKYTEEFSHLPSETFSDWDLIYSLADFDRTDSYNPQRIVRLAKRLYDTQPIIRPQRAEQVIPQKVIHSDFYKHFQEQIYFYLKEIKQIKAKEHYIEAFALYWSHPSSLISSWQDVQATFSSTIQADSLRIRSKKDIQEQLSNDDLGAMFELALVSFLNNFFPETVFHRPLSPLAAQAAAVAKAGQPDISLVSDPFLAINCKFFLSDRSAYTLHCSPEHSFPDPWIAFMNRKIGLLFMKNAERKEYLDFAQGRGISVEDFLTYVSETYDLPLKKEEIPHAAETQTKD